MVRHGGCLGLGLAAMGSHRQDVYEQLKFNLYQDDAVTGEAAGIAMGMVMLGSKSTQAIEDMVAVSLIHIAFFHPLLYFIFYINNIFLVIFSNILLLTILKRSIFHIILNISKLWKYY